MKKSRRNVALCFAVAALIPIAYWVVRPRPRGGPWHTTLGAMWDFECAITWYSTDWGSLPVANAEEDRQEDVGAVLELVLPEYADESLRRQMAEDPWGHPYRLALDSDNDGLVRVGDRFLRRRVAVWSDGPNEVNEFGEGDDLHVRNWEWLQ